MTKPKYKLPPDPLVPAVFRPADYRWDPVPIRDSALGQRSEHSAQTFRRWTPSAKYCLISGRDCRNCDNGQSYQMAWKPKGNQSQCWMPESIQLLLDYEVTPSQPARNKTKSFGETLAPEVREAHRLKVREMFRNGLGTRVIYEQLDLPKTFIDQLITESARLDGFNDVRAYRQAFRTHAQLKAEEHARKSGTGLLGHW